MVAVVSAVARIVAVAVAFASGQNQVAAVAAVSLAVAVDAVVDVASVRENAATRTFLFRSDVGLKGRVFLFCRYVEEYKMFKHKTTNKVDG
ncbi:hypothetical protein [Haladaptatus sp. DYF46]|uniref:hypothetical protein n=1 Tax=Haladaptatus sp. DYF46 TaxID=2886041 RepID=UPI001E5E290A|nr:hypothetical protein [Haladaptatus sp. DYF46]